MELKIKGKDKAVRSIAKILREEGINVVKVREEIEKKKSFFTPIEKMKEVKESEGEMYEPKTVRMHPYNIKREYHNRENISKAEIICRLEEILAHHGKEEISGLIYDIECLVLKRIKVTKKEMEECRANREKRKKANEEELKVY